MNDHNVRCGHCMKGFFIGHLHVCDQPARSCGHRGSASLPRLGDPRPMVKGSDKGLGLHKVSGQEVSHLTSDLGVQLKALVRGPVPVLAGQVNELNGGTAPAPVKIAHWLCEGQVIPFERREQQGAVHAPQRGPSETSRGVKGEQEQDPCRYGVLPAPKWPLGNETEVSLGRAWRGECRRVGHRAGDGDVMGTHPKEALDDVPHGMQPHMEEVPKGAPPTIGGEGQPDDGQGGQVRNICHPTLDL
mmetsp:Transcript_58602/g.104543  ORF Transcript_58602/g.104543 Transcript_58602/m.104543 type:complete len:245 (+) Transcript_58602:887-1621(+)